MAAATCQKFLLATSCSAATAFVGFLVGVTSERRSLEPATVHSASPPLPDVVPSQLPASSQDPNIAIGNRTSQIMRFGFPSTDQLHLLDNYVLSYDRRNRVAHWVFEHLTRDDPAKSKNAAVDRSRCSFREDPSVHPFFRSSDNDYLGSGFDRGHLAAAGNHRHSQRACDQTFLLSNMAPQVGRGFNRDGWNKLEKHVRHLTKSYVNVYVCTGPLYLPRKEDDGKMYVKYQVIGPNGVAVPSHFFKVVVGETATHELEMEAYVMPNAVIDDRTPITSFRVPPESIERAAGFLLFDRVPRDRFNRINGRKMTYV